VRIQRIEATRFRLAQALLAKAALFSAGYLPKNAKRTELQLHTLLTKGGPRCHVC
jgi:hypothetical protein